MVAKIMLLIILKDKLIINFLKFFMIIKVFYFGDKKLAIRNIYKNAN
jgi:hypothetical protein